MRRVFISRDLQVGSVFKEVLEGQGVEVFGMSLIQFNSIDFEVPDCPDWVFFYSKNGVRFFLEKVGLDWFENVKIGAIGTGTGDYLKTKKLTPNFIGNGKPLETAQQFSEKINGASVLFPRAKTSRKSVQELLNDAVEIRDLIVYENIEKKNLAIERFDVLVFTSPLNAKAYFKINELIDNQIVIAIGATTARTLKALKITNYFIANEPSEKGLVNSVIQNLGSL